MDSDNASVLPRHQSLLANYRPNAVLPLDKIFSKNLRKSQETPLMVSETKSKIRWFFWFLRFSQFSIDVSRTRLFPISSSTQPFRGILLANQAFDEVIAIDSSSFRTAHIFSLPRCHRSHMSCKWAHNGAPSTSDFCYCAILLHAHLCSRLETPVMAQLKEGHGADIIQRWMPTFESTPVPLNLDHHMRRNGSPSWGE